MFTVDTTEATQAVELRTLWDDPVRHQPATGRPFDVTRVRLVYQQNATGPDQVAAKLMGADTHEWLYGPQFPDWLREQVTAHTPHWYNDTEDNSL